MNEIGLKDSSISKSSVVPAEQAIRDMLAQVRVIRSPERIIVGEFQHSLAPEFDSSAVQNGKVIGVAQAHMDSTSEEPIKTTNVDKCNVALIRYGKPPRYDLIHNQNGDMDQNAPGSRWDDIKGRYDINAQVIPISSYKSIGVIPTMRQLRYKGVVTKKRIEVESGISNIDVVYRPKDNKILIRIGGTQEVQEYEGF